MNSGGYQPKIAARRFTVLEPSRIPMLSATNNADMNNDVETVVEGDEPSGDENAALYEGGDEYMMGLM